MNLLFSRRALPAWMSVLITPASAGPVQLMLAHNYRAGLRLSDWVVSEKYDGVRGYWDGERLWTRGGEPVAAPGWFTERLPAHPLDGELWAGRGKFGATVSAVRQNRADPDAWRRIRYMVFDLPAHKGRYAERSAEIARVMPALGRPFLQAVQPASVTSEKTLRAMLEGIVRDGGEGLVLHRLDGRYRPGRSPDVMKLKTDDDADAMVLSHVPGRGKHEGMMGALWVETPEGERFKLGTGFDDATRRNPPPVGAWISYRFRGETESGLPRFASFLRVRSDR